MNRNELMSKKHSKVCRVLNYIDHSLIVISTVTGCVSISAFASLIGIPIVNWYSYRNCKFYNRIKNVCNN